MKKLFIFFTLFIIGCTSEVPQNMEEELAFRSDRWMKGSDWSVFWYSFQYKVYNGPAYTTHKNGERKEKGDIVNGTKSGLWSGWDEKGNLKYKGAYLLGKEDDLWKGYFSNGKTKYEGKYKSGKQIKTWKYYNKKGKMTTEETYFTCDEKCEESHWPRPCKKEGKVKSSKDFK